MIVPGTRYLPARVPLSRIVFTFVEPRYPAKVMEYYHKLRAEPERDMLINVQPLGGGYYGVLDGQHRVMAHLLAGRADVQAVVIIEPGQPGYDAASDPVDMTAAEPVMALAG